MSNFTKLAWNNLNWTLVQGRVFRIQRRIFKARKEEKMGVVHYLQDKIIHSLDAKLLSVRQAIPVKKDKNAKNVEKKLSITPQEKWKLANSLTLNGQTDISYCLDHLKFKNSQKGRLDLLVIKDKAKQNLVKLALEPEWEAVFESESYGFRSGRCSQDAIEALLISTNLRPKYVLNVNLSNYLDHINQKALLEKLNTSSIIEAQIEAWLDSDILTSFSQSLKSEQVLISLENGQNNIISPLLLNIAFHGLETYLRNWYDNFDYSQQKQQCRNEFDFIRYADQFVILNSNRQVIEEAKIVTENWLNQIGLTLDKEENQIKNTTEGFCFLGFHIILVNRDKKYQCRIHISKMSKQSLLKKTRLIIQKNKAASSYQLINQLTPIIINWANYFQYVDCSKEFQTMDHVIFTQLRAWVFRRKAPSLNRQKLKKKYFPPGKIYIYKGVQHSNNWVLTGQKKLQNGKLVENFLPKLSWIPSKKFIKVKGSASVYDGNFTYWTLRLGKSNFYGITVK